MPLSVVAQHALPLAPPVSLPLRLRVARGRFGAYRKSDGPARFHEGVDLLAAEGAGVFPVYGGRVIDARPGGMDNRAEDDGIVRVYHQPTGPGYISVYAHLKTVDVAVNEWVEVGKRLGTIGVPVGETWPAHLHFELRHVIADDPSGLSFSDRNRSLRRQSSSMAVDPTAQLYHWETEQYQNTRWC